MILAIVGSRSIKDSDKVFKAVLQSKVNVSAVEKIITGDEIGVDSSAIEFSNKFSIPIEVIAPDWLIGKHAGPVCKEKIAAMADEVIAVWDGKSSATLYLIEFALWEQKPVFVFVGNRGVWWKDYDSWCGTHPIGKPSPELSSKR